MKLLVIAVVLTLVGAFVGTQKAFAECQLIYGGGQTCVNPPLVINKTVFNSGANAYVHDMGITDPRFHPGDQVAFHLTVTNTGNTSVANVIVKDILPNFISASNPAFNPTTSSISFNAGTLVPGQSQTYTVIATIGPAGSFPSNQPLTCLNNQAEADSQTMNIAASDFSQFCVEVLAGQPTPGLTNITPSLAPTVFPSPPTPTLPPTGVDPIPLLALLPTGLTGFFLRKLANSFKKKRIK